MPPDLPVPLDDGACQHLLGRFLPHCRLRSTQGSWVDPSAIPGWLVIYCYPLTGRPAIVPPTRLGPDSRCAGCTPQACAFRDDYQELRQLQAQVFGLCGPAIVNRRPPADRLHLPFALLSDAAFEFSDALKLPTFEVQDMRLNKRLTLIARDGVIQHYFYPGVSARQKQCAGARLAKRKRLSISVLVMSGRVFAVAGTVRVMARRYHAATCSQNGKSNQARDK